jgi:C4-dicarboxylate-specific signal transduction histidine kinase
MSLATQAGGTVAAQQASGRRPRTNAEAARYSVLRRLAPALKHDMVVNLQAVAMMAEVLSARIEKGSPSVAELEGSISKMNRLAREAVMTCLKVAAWISPSDEETVRLREGVDDCVALLRSSFNFRGCTLANEVPDSEFEVSRVALRNLVAASLLSLADAAAAPSDLVVSAEISPGFAVLTVRCSPRTAGDGLAVDAIAVQPGYRAVDWNDVQALALAEGIELFRTQEQIVMRIPRMVATGPLQIAPV